MIALLLTLLVGIFIVVGIILGNKLKENKKFIDIAIGIAFGVMTILILLDIIPEAYEMLYNSTKNIIGIIILIISTIIGFLILKLLDSFVPHHEHEALHHHKHKNEKCHNEHLEHVGILATIAIVIHNIIEGMTLYVTAYNNTKAGLLLCIAIGLHNIPLGIVISSTLQRKKELIINSVILALSTFTGGLIILLVNKLISDMLVGILLSITLGMIIYITFMELLPQIIFNKDKKDSFLGIGLGVVLILISMFLG